MRHDGFLTSARRTFPGPQGEDKRQTRGAEVKLPVIAADV